jgi:pimeloyl-ACP methyl ester carboxylesterase
MTDETTTKLKFGGWGSVAGAVIVMIVGFSWGGWVTAGTAKDRTEKAVVASRSAICVAQFMKASDHKGQLKAFKQTDSWKRSDFIAKGGWDKMPGDDQAKDLVTSACSDGIETLISK